jgi:hypothetical protein
MRQASYIAAMILLAGTSASILPGCGNAMIAAKEYMGVPKRDQMVARVQDARDSQTEAKQQFASALEEFIAVTKVDSGELEARYKSFSAKYDGCEASAGAVNQRIADVERVAAALFAEWEKEVGEYSNPSMKAESQADLDRTKATYGKLLTSMKTAAAKMVKPLTNFKDQVRFLKHKLNARAIAGLEGTAQEISKDVESLIKEMNASIDEANQFISQMQVK